MTISLVPNALEHINSQELARLSALWYAQASAGQIEAREIAKSFADELMKRLDSGKMDYFKTSNFGNQKTWWRSLILKIEDLKNR
jgi:hypothetical protein